MNPRLRDLGPEIWKSYPLPIVALVPATTNVDALLGIFYSLHGGLGWLLILAALPWVSIRVARLTLTGPEETKQQRRSQAFVIALGYVLLSIASSAFLAWRLSPPIQLTIINTLPWYYFPLSLFFGW